jgi:NAD(P)H-dependent flavin oxidoreductase YrpB (nitropropane dioxygenase family)
VPPSYKQSIVAAGAADTVFTRIPDFAPYVEWPGAWSRVLRNRLVERWLGKEEELRTQHADRVGAEARAARAGDDRDEMKLFAGQSSGLVGAIEPAADVVRRVSREAEELLAGRAAAVVVRGASAR